MNKVEKSLRWVVNQIPDFKPTTNEEKMLVAIKLYSEAGAEEIKRLEAENASLRERLNKAVELKAKIGDTVYMPWFYDEANGIATLKIVSISVFKDEIIYHTDFESDNIDFCSIYNYGTFYDYDFGVKVFTTPEAAEARLKELKGERNNAEI